MSIAALPIPITEVWTEDEYLDLPGGQFVEFDHGRVEVLPMPTMLHQKVAQRLLRALEDFVDARGLGDVLAAPFPVKVGDEQYREPDVVFRRSSSVELDERVTRFWDHVELVIEVLSDGSKNRARDLVTKRREYADARIAEYWIVDLDVNEITVLSLQGDDYIESGRYRMSQTARSVVLPQFAVAVQSIIAPKK